MAAIGAECNCLSFDELVVLVKAESTYSDDSAPVAGTDAVLMTGQPTVTVLGSRLSRDIAKGYWGNDASNLVNRFVQIEGECELVGPGAAGDVPGIATLLRICGLAETITASTDAQYDPASLNVPSASIYFYHAQDLWRVVGCRANLQLMYQAGQYPKARFTIVGLFDLPENNAAIPAITFPTDGEPLAVNFENTPTSSFFAGADTGGGAFSGNFDVDRFDFNLGNVLEQRDVPGCYSVQISDRNPTATLVGCAPTLDVINFWELAEAGTTGAFQFIHGVNAGEIVQFDASTLEMDLTQMQNTQIGTNQKGISIGLFPLPTNGDDDFKLTFM